MKFHLETLSKKIGFRDSLRSALGVLIILYLLSSASLIGISQLLGIPVLLSGSVLLTASVLLLIAVEILRRYVLITRASGKGHHAVACFRRPYRQPEVHLPPPTAPAATASGKLVFANQLRGVCVLAVMVVHYTVVVQFLRKDVAWVVASPTLNTPIPNILPYVYPSWLDLGKFGVAAFFLISGFVIPFSLRGATRSTFLLSRALRIFPTFWASLLAQWVAIAASGAYWHIPPAFSARAYLPNALLIDSALTLPSVDWVSWTLSIEVKFYVLAALLRPLILAHRVWPLLATTAAALALNIGAHAGWIALPPALAAEAMYLGYIQIGTAFYYRYQSAISRPQLAACVLALFAVFLVNYDLGPSRVDFRSLHTASFGLAILVFAAGYALRARFRPLGLLDAMAAISYPLYLVHAAIGFAIINFLIMARQIPYPAAALLAAAACMLLAWLIHAWVENPTIRLGHRLRANRLC